MCLYRGKQALRGPAIVGGLGGLWARTPHGERTVYSANAALCFRLRLLQKPPRASSREAGVRVCGYAVAAQERALAGYLQTEPCGAGRPEKKVRAHGGEISRRS
jgi:hypothetical protein